MYCLKKWLTLKIIFVCDINNITFLIRILPDIDCSGDNCEDVLSLKEVMPELALFQICFLLFSIIRIHWDYENSIFYGLTGFRMS